MKITTIIVAGGSGSRMGTETPKQFLLLGGLPILMHTIIAMKKAVDKYVNNFIIVLPKSQITQWHSLCISHNFDIEHLIALGGANRFESVKSGMSFLQDPDIVLIHDGVRPFIDRKIVEKVIETTNETGAAIPVIDIADSLREIVNNSSKIVNRSNYRAVQTPQGFKKEIITKAYSQIFDKSFTDDASVVESAGYSVKLTEGDARNIKITTPSDLEYANYLIETRLEK